MQRNRVELQQHWHPRAFFEVESELIGKMQNNFPYLDTWPNNRSKFCSVMVWWVEILTIKVILDQVQLQARKSYSCSKQCKLLGLKLLPFSFFNPSETLENVNSSFKSLASREFGSFYYMWDHYRPVQIRSVKKLMISGTILFNWKVLIYRRKQAISK